MRRGVLESKIAVIGANLALAIGSLGFAWLSLFAVGKFIRLREKSRVILIGSRDYYHNCQSRQYFCPLTPHFYHGVAILVKFRLKEFFGKTQCAIQSTDAIE